MEKELLNEIIERVNLSENELFSLNNYEIIKDWERNKIIRLSLKTLTEEKSLIVKIIKDNHTCGFNDFAGLKFLTNLDTKSAIVPKFYFGNVEDKYFVMEDLQTKINLEHYLNGNNYQNTKLITISLILKRKNIIKQRMYLRKN